MTHHLAMIKAIIVKEILPILPGYNIEYSKGDNNRLIISTFIHSFKDL